MKIGIIGSLGVVGQACYNGLIKNHEVIGYDLKNKDLFKNSEKNYQELLKTEMVFICLQTPTNLNGQDLGYVERSLKKLVNHGYKGIVVIKSTIIPGTIDKFKKRFDLNFVHNPEFLSADTANDDFENQKEIIIGGYDDDSIQKVFDVHKSIGVTKAHVGTPIQSELIKYIHNVFLTVKVGIMNEFYDICIANNCEFQPLVNAAADVTGWINKRHIKVPCKGKLGYGGDCFPKDIGALYEVYKHLNLDIINGCIESNKRRRRSAKNLLDRPLKVLEVENASKRTIKRKRPQRKVENKVRTGPIAG